MKQNDPPINDRKFNDYDWDLIAFFAGFEVIDIQDVVVILGSYGSSGYGRIELHDNGGEINILVERPTMTNRQKILAELLTESGLEVDRYNVRHPDTASLPYTSTAGQVSEYTLAARLLRWLLQEPIDWQFLEPNPEMEWDGWDN